MYRQIDMWKRGRARGGGGRDARSRDITHHTIFTSLPLFEPTVPLLQSSQSRSLSKKFVRRKQMIAALAVSLSKGGQGGVSSSRIRH